ncbi:MAG: AI-2E family transporter, partial [Bacteroidales bacterium]|nr:AI-2E family transporter [Bacteroidales bacterium]
MLKKYHLLFLIIGILLAAFIVWYFSNIVIYVLVSVVLSFIGHPLLKYLDKIKIRKFKIPHSLNAFITLLVILFVFVCFIWFFVPLITNQANMISNINI